MPITWSDEVDDILAGDMTAGLTYPTPAKGVVIIPVSPLARISAQAVPRNLR